MLNSFSRYRLKDDNDFIKIISSLPNELISFLEDYNINDPMKEDFLKRVIYRYYGDISYKKLVDSNMPLKAVFLKNRFVGLYKPEDIRNIDLNLSNSNEDISCNIFPEDIRRHEEEKQNQIKENLVKENPKEVILNRRLELQEEKKKYENLVLEDDEKRKNEIRGVKDKKLLVLCANNRSYIDQRWIDISKRFINTNEYTPYYTGLDILNKEGVRFNGSFDSINFFNIFGEQSLDCIISEHCPHVILSLDSLTKIFRLLKDGGVFITPIYSSISKFNEKVKMIFTKDEIYDRHYICYTK